MWQEKQRVIQEHVPGRQLTLAHIIANPDASLYASLGVAEAGQSAIGVLTITPPETSIILADIAIKAAGVKLVDLDRVSGSLLLTGTVSEVEAAITAILAYVAEKLDFEVCKLTKT